MKDLFGHDVMPGDYLVFHVKGQHGAMGIGLVTSVTTKAVSMIAIEGRGQTIPEMIVSRKETYDRLVANYAKSGTKMSRWAQEYAPGNLARRKTLQSASTCYRVPAFAVPPEITQAISEVKST